MDQKQQLADRLKQANNILVTVSNNPSVDQLAACIGLTLTLNKMGKHATAVFSGQIPSTIEFLQPEKTLESNTDSLRDFIISLDKTKADKLRYKVEDQVVRIFITPYRTSISEKDLEFSQGDFNVDVVLALGVHDQAELDQAITSHGRILHDATIATINVKPGGELGSLNWLEPQASSLSELGVQLVDALDKGLVDPQIATAFLTGVVAETKRFSNEKTTPATMSVSAELVAAGANPQLVATKLEEPEPVPPAPEPPKDEPDTPKDDQPAEGQVAEPHAAEQPQETKPNDGSLEISHTEESDENKDDEENKPLSSLEDLAGKDKDDASDQAASEEPEEKETPRIHIDEHGSLRTLEEIEADKKEGKEEPIDADRHGGSRMILQPPALGGTMSASGMTDDTYRDPLSLPQPSDPSAATTPPPAPATTPFSSPASATITPPPTPFMPASMTPGGAPVAPPEPPAPAPAATPPAPNPPSLGQSAPSTPPAPEAPSAEPKPFAFPGSAPSGDVALPGMPPSGGDQSTPPDLVPAQQPDTAHVDNARDAVMQAFASQPHDPARPQPIHALNAQPLGGPLHTEPPASAATPPDLNVPVPADTPPGTLNIPSPVGPPPPGPPPMVPQQ